LSKEYKRRFALVVQKDLQHMDGMKTPGNRAILDDVMATTWQKHQQVMELPDTDDLTQVVNKVNEVFNGGGPGLARFVNTQNFPNLSPFMSSNGSTLTIPPDLVQAGDAAKADLQTLLTHGISNKRRQMISQMLQAGLTTQQVKEALSLIDRGHSP